MKFVFRSPRVSVVLLAALGMFSAACSDNGGDSDTGPATQDVVKNYAAMVSANYGDALSTAKTLGKAVDAFIEAPSQARLDAARAAWLECRNPYGESEAYRFYQGPIDNDDSDDDIPDGPEPLMNSWPLDESAIDYVLDGDGMVLNGGIINLTDDFPTIDRDVISAENAKASETTITTGYHAIEFLLWGQDESVDGPGDRPYTDYIEGDGATAENQARRAQYLRVVTDLLIADLTTVNDAWLEGEPNYRADFEALAPKEALGKMLLGMGSLSGAELSGERMGAAFDHKDQEDEHSCFSDNTLKDLHNNATSVQNVLLGHYGDFKPSMPSRRKSCATSCKKRSTTSTPFRPPSIKPFWGTMTRRAVKRSKPPSRRCKTSRTC
jgi:putative iron-regulated protein